MRIASRPAAIELLLAVQVVLLCRSGVAQNTTSTQTESSQLQQKATSAIHQYFRGVTSRLSDAALADVKALDDWQRQRPVLRAQLFEMLGLDPMPPRTDLHATVTGSLEHDEFVVEKLHFQSRPGLYVTANFYRPKRVDKPLPTILYLCGHGNIKIDGVSYGSKANYQHHPAWFVREGYCCLILDTLQLGEIEGLHHGTYREGMWWWLSQGYTPAGVEAWNAVRALDYLETRPEVDMKRIGVTGRSGGGAYTWWLAAIDDRPACLVPVAGVTDLENHVVDGCIEGHCDCMFMVNTYRWDFATLAALVAPRPLLLSNSDKDRIFPLDGVVRTHAKVKRIYELHNAADKLGLLITEGPHKDTQELQVPAFRWMNRWLQSKDEPITRVADKPLDPKQLKVFHELPADQINTAIFETFVPRAKATPPPKTRDEWDSLRRQLLGALENKCFRGWPKAPPPLATRIVSDKESSGQRLQVIEYTSADNIRLAAYKLSAAQSKSKPVVEVTVPSSEGWEEWSAKLPIELKELLPLETKSGADATEVQAQRDSIANTDCVQIVLVPRGIGPNRWDQDQRKDFQIRRRFALLGQTWEGEQVWDVVRGVQAIKELDELKNSTIRVIGEGTQSGVALYAGIFSPLVDEIHLKRPALSHRDGPHFLNVLRVCDMPQAVALAFPRKVTITESEESAWEWPASIARLMNHSDVLLEFGDLAR
jgi:cephalosporin-C deacetylase-like acetyl esterase